MPRFSFLRRGRHRVGSDVDEELHAHLDRRTEELVAGGMSPKEARTEALRQFGDLEAARAYCRQQDNEKDAAMQRRLMLEDFAQDLRIGLRGLLRAPMTTLVVVTTVGLGIGATTTIFAAVNASLLRPLPYANPARLVRIYTDTPPNRFPFSVADYLALEAQQTTFERVAAYESAQMTYSDGVTAERLQGRRVTWTYFDTLGVRPAIGRDFTIAEGMNGGPKSVIVSHQFWQSRLGGRLDAMGEPIRLDAVAYTLVGVLPDSVGPLERKREFFIAAQFETPRRHGPFFLAPIGRLKTSASAAADELHAISHRLFYRNNAATWSQIDLRTWIVGDSTSIAALAIAAVVLVWLIASLNASNLLVARVTNRRRELAVRVALGATHGRIVRYLFGESVLLAFGAATLGVAIAYVGVSELRNFGADYFPRAAEMAIDGSVLGLVLGLTLGSTLIFGLIPAVTSATSQNVEMTLRSSGRSSTGTRGVRRLRRALVGAQFAIVTPVLVVGGLLLTSLSALSRVNLGFDGHNVVGGAVLLPASQYPPARAIPYWDELQRRVASIPGVTAVAFADGRPPNGSQNFNDFDLEASPTPPGRAHPVVPWISVSIDYFKLLGLTLIEGRLFDDRDWRDDTAENSVVVDRAWARRFFPGGSAVGQRLHSGGCAQCPWTVVVGVVNEVKYAGLDKPDEGTVYEPLNRESNAKYLLVRTAASPSAVIAPLRDTVRGLDADVPLSEVATIEDLVEEALARPRSLSILVAAVAGVGLLLSVIGIYGVMAYYVQQHAKDISIRVALGGSRADLFRRVVGHGMIVVAIGVGVGLLMSYWAARAMAGLLFGVRATDAVMFSSVAGLLAAVALTACALPARRASAMSPASVLRDD
jgi:predicted permease